MNLHLMQASHTVFGVYESIDGGSKYMDVALISNEVIQFLKKNQIIAIPYTESYSISHDRNTTDEYNEGQAEYLLTEKQSALFLLRFK